MMGCADKGSTTSANDRYVEACPSKVAITCPRACATGGSLEALKETIASVVGPERLVQLEAVFCQIADSARSGEPFHSDAHFVERVTELAAQVPLDRLE